MRLERGFEVMETVKHQFLEFTKLGGKGDRTVTLGITGDQSF
jgi:hypothetical protein